MRVVNLFFDFQFRFHDSYISPRIAQNLNVAKKNWKHLHVEYIYLYISLKGFYTFRRVFSFWTYTCEMYYVKVDLTELRLHAVERKHPTIAVALGRNFFPFFLAKRRPGNVASVCCCDRSAFCHLVSAETNAARRIFADSRLFLFPPSSCSQRQNRTRFQTAREKKHRPTVTSKQIVESL